MLTLIPVNDLPAGIRSPNYCSGVDILGHQRAKDMNCLPHFESKECREEFGLDGKAYKARKQEQKEIAKKQKDELKALYNDHDKEE